MTKIEWTEKTWNPVTGCTKVSPGCDHCYAEGIARRFAGSKAFPNGFDVTLHPERLDAPLRWRKPSRVFVNSMSDLFHQDVPDDYIARLWAVMAATPQHTYQILTKRPARMRSLLRDECRCPDRGHAPGVHFRSAMEWTATPHSPTYVPGLESGIYHRMQWPLPNVWLGVSVEDQKRADLRIPALLDTPAAVRFLSCEPLLGPVSIWEHISNPSNLRRLAGRPMPHLDWVIVGGESGPGARRMELQWARTLVRQCKDAGIAPFVKQLGSVHGPHKGGDIDTWPAELQVREYPAGVAA